MTQPVTRAHNFSPGPCVLPASVLAELSEELPDFNGQGMSLIEMSHRDPVYDEIHCETIDLLTSLWKVPNDFSVLLLQGGASLQFAMAPLNLLGEKGDTAGYIVSGSWAAKAIADAKLIGDTYSAWTGADHGFTRMPTADEVEIRPGTRYLHVTSNETIGGIRLPDFFDPGVPMVADMSSDYLTRHIPWDRFDLVYGGAQKSLGPAGLTVVFVRQSVLDATPDGIPAYLRYDTHASANSVANTPPVFAVWATGKMLRWVGNNGGVDGMEKRATERSSMVYRVIDDSQGYYRSPVEPVDRSTTNIVFRLPTEEAEAAFLAGAASEQLLNLKGHRSVGGIRASIYNGLATESVQALVDFMERFAADGR